MTGTFKKILLIQFRPIGDVLLSTPLVTVLRRRFPGAHIAFMVEPLPGQVLENNPDLDEILYYRRKKNDIAGSLRFFRSVGKRQWDLTVDIFGTPGTAWAAFFSRAAVRVGYSLRLRKYAYTHTVSHHQPDRYSALKKFSLLKAVGIEEECADLTLRLREREYRYADSFFRDNNIDTRNLTVCFAPGAKRQAKGWRHAGWSRLGGMLQEMYDANIVIVWGPGEDEAAAKIAEAMAHKPYIIPSTTLREMAAIIARSHLFISNCSGPKHIATAVGTPTITIYGPTSPATWTHPDATRHRFVRGNVPCIGCDLTECQHQSCMHAVSAEDVAGETRRIPELNELLKGKTVLSKN